MRKNTGLVLAPRTVVGYHGCTEAAAETILSSGDFRLSRKEFDWLGIGFYFFEYAPHRAWEWAEAVATRSGERPAVIQASIRLGRCFNLLDIAHMEGLPEVYTLIAQRYEAQGTPLPRNTSRGAHFLDQEVINFYCDQIEESTSEGYQTVRGCFPEGQPIYPGSKILTKTHVQVAVRDAACISQARRLYLY